uniref:D-glucuronyl C5-epimerase family protein n=1 Tax=Algoriphagus sp. TaxID=1872435 RepID=UPI0040489A10
MIQKFLKRLVLASILAIIFVSYFEKPFINLFMPLRELIMVPQVKIINNNVGKKYDPILPYKASKDGYYINPWEAATVVNNISNNILINGCEMVVLEDKDKLKIFADYFLNSAKIREHNGVQFAVWEFPINYTYGLKPGWLSSMAQARIAKILYSCLKCEIENETASLYNAYYKLALNSFDVTVQNGGVLVNLPIGIWFEEYSQETIIPPLVLNGHIYATLDLYQLGKFDDRAKKIAMKGLNSVKWNIQYYDALTWSFYDRVKTPANNIYQQRLHARQMKELYNLTKDKVFLKFSKKFQNQLFFPFSSIQRFYLYPTNFLGFLLFVNVVFFLILFSVLELIYRKVKYAL